MVLKFWNEQINYKLYEENVFKQNFLIPKPEKICLKSSNGCMALTSQTLPLKTSPQVVKTRL